MKRYIPLAMLLLVGCAAPPKHIKPGYVFAPQTCPDSLPSDFTPGSDVWHSIYDNAFIDACLKLTCETFPEACE